LLAISGSRCLQRLLRRTVPIRLRRTRCFLATPASRLEKAGVLRHHGRTVEAAVRVVQRDQGRISGKDELGLELAEVLGVLDRCGLVVSAQRKGDGYRVAEGKPVSELEQIDGRILVAAQSKLIADNDVPNGLRPFPRVEPAQEIPLPLTHNVVKDNDRLGLPIMVLGVRDRALVVV